MVDYIVVTVYKVVLCRARGVILCKSGRRDVDIDHVTLLICLKSASIASGLALNRVHRSKPKLWELPCVRILALGRPFSRAILLADGVAYEVNGSADHSSARIVPLLPSTFSERSELKESMCIARDFDWQRSAQHNERRSELLFVEALFC